MQAFRFAAAAAVAALLSTPALALTAPTVVARGDTIETLKAAGQFTTLLKAFDATNLTGVIKAQKSLTVFAPTDAAFAALPAGELDRLMKEPAALQGVLTYHLINSPIEAAKLAGAKGPVNTVAGTGLVLDGSGEGLKANDAVVLVAEVKTTSGLLYVVDKVLSPEGAAAAMAVPADTMPAEAAPAP